MKILLTGATGYIGKRLLPVLLEQGHKVICCVRDKRRFSLKPSMKKATIFEVDFLEEVDTTQAPLDFDIAYYLIHSMSAAIGEFNKMEAQTAQNFVSYLNASQAKQIIYLTGITNEDKELSLHLESRLQVQKILETSTVPLTALRAGIIVGSGSASFEIIRDLVEKLPIMVTPVWLKTQCQPIGIRNVIEYLTGAIEHPECMGKTFDIGCKEVLSYKEMLMQYAEVRKLNRWIFVAPVMTPRLSSYWLYFITSTTYNLAVNLVDSMKVDVICSPNNLAQTLDIHLYTYKESVEMAFNKIKQNSVMSSWKDAMVISAGMESMMEYIEVPEYGCFTDLKKRKISPTDVPRILDNIWSIGGKRGWYYGNGLWKLRGYMDKLVGGIGLRRGRTHTNELEAGDALDFWRVLVADKSAKRLLLYAEMKLPGDAWLEFEIMEDEDGQLVLKQLATFRPDGILGRLYWYAVLPFHYFVFNGMVDNLVKYQET